MSRKKLFSHSVLILTVALLYSCERNCVEGRYSMEAERQVNQNRNFFRVGDTLRFKYSFSRCGYENIRQRDVCLPDLEKASMRFAFRSYDSTALVDNVSGGKGEGALDKFSFTITKGTWSQEALFGPHLKSMIQVHFVGSVNEYLAELFVICRSPGLYSISNSHIGSRFAKEECKTVSLETIGALPTTDYVQMFGVQDWHSHPQLEKEVYYLRVR